MNPIIPELANVGAGDLVVVGAPWEEGSSYLRGTALGPGKIRQALLSEARSLVTETGRDLAHDARVRILGDLELDPEGGYPDTLESFAEEVSSRGAHPLTIGGDHSITTGLVRAVARHHPGLTLLQIDAHPDLYEVYDGNRWSHACPMARILEEGLVGRLVQVGIRAMTPEQQQVADRYGVEVIDMRSWRSAELAVSGLESPLYVSLDLDGLDPAFAPGVSHPEPGGLTTREVLEVLQRLPQPVVGADLVELNPTRDPLDLTAVVAGKLLKELAARMLEEDTQ